jgi:hypothetical protein
MGRRDRRPFSFYEWVHTAQTSSSEGRFEVKGILSRLRRSLSRQADDAYTRRDAADESKEAAFERGRGNAFGSASDEVRGIEGKVSAKAVEADARRDETTAGTLGNAYAEGQADAYADASEDVRGTEKSGPAEEG